MHSRNLHSLFYLVHMQKPKPMSEKLFFGNFTLRNGSSRSVNILLNFRQLEREILKSDTSYSEAHITQETEFYDLLLPITV